MSITRRKFLRGAAAATGAATLGFPMIAKAQGPISMRWQSTWPAKDIFHEYANDFGKKINDMSGGDLRIEVLPAGAVGPAYGMTAQELMAWHKYGGGKELLQKIFSSIGANVVSFPYGPMWTQPLGWFKKPISKVEDLKGIKFRTVGISIDVFQGLGAA